MTDDDRGIPEYLRDAFRTHILEELSNRSFFNLHDLSLFRWHLHETEKLHAQMLKAEEGFINEQIEANPDFVDDSGLIPVEYFLRRARYADVIQLASLLETVLERECERLAEALPTQSIPFAVKELKGDKWTARRKFLERYGHFDQPEELWKPINILITLRNSVVHDNGSVEALSEGDRSALTRCSGLDVTGSEINIDRSYVISALGALEDLTRYYEQRVSTAIKRAIQPGSI